MSIGDPVGEPEISRSFMIRLKAATGIGSSTAPTTCMRPLGASVPTMASQSSGTLTVTSSRSSVPAMASIAAESRLETTWWAPKPRASSDFAAAGGERGDVAAPRGGELDRHVAQAADADHADARGRP